MKQIDMHVHIAGNGSSGSGCKINLNPKQKKLAGFLARQIGLPSDVIDGDLDRHYANKLLSYVKSSSLDAIVILAQEHVYSDDGDCMQNSSMFYVPNSYVLDLSDRHPEFLAAVSIHPIRSDAIEELEVCIERGAALMKCLPLCQNINCNDKRYKPFWQKMADANLPLLAHTGGENIIPIVKKEYASPEYLRLPLECGVKVIAAHCGTRGRLFDANYVAVLSSMMEEYDNLYADLSAMASIVRSKFIPLCMERPIIKRLVHGSDFPVASSAFSLFIRGLIDFTTYRLLRKERNPLEKDLELKRAMGFPEETFTRAWSLLPEKAKIKHNIQVSVRKSEDY